MQSTTPRDAPASLDTRREPTYDLCFVLGDLWQRPERLVQLGRAVSARLGGTALVSADAGYWRAADAAVVFLRLDPSLVTGPLVATLARGGESAGAATVELAKAPEDRQRLEDALAGCSPVVRDVPTPEHPVIMLAEALGLAEPPPPAVRTPPGVRFRRGDTWTRGRLCRIGDDGVFIATAAPPRVGDRLEVELATQEGPLVAPAVATRVAAGPALAALGSAGFAARFAFANAGEQRVAAAGIAPLRRRLAATCLPPHRRDLRFPVRWPAFAVGDGSRSALRLLDVSRRGLFAGGSAAPVGERLDLEVPIDTSGAPVPLSARVARRSEAGVGLEIEDLPSGAATCYEQFVDRVAARANQRLVVGAAPERLAALADELSGVGYLVQGATSVRELCARALEGRRPPELILIDSTLDGGAARARALRRALAARRFCTLHVDGEAPAPARRLVDAALVS